MMASYILFVVCVVLCTVQSAHSYNITGRIRHTNGTDSEVQVSDYIDGENWIDIQTLTLDRLVGAGTLPTLTVANFDFIRNLELNNIALEHVPVFVNTSCEYMHITGNEIQSVPANAFSELRPKVLNLSNNEIHSMADKSINTDAVAVHLRCNKLSNFSQSWFEAPGNVEGVVLNSNRIEYIQDRAFHQMTKLKTLYLANNRITSIGSGAFPSGITRLLLHFNNIGQLTPGMFADREEPIHDLFFHYNQLSYLPKALLLKLKPREISLFGNPWQCYCLRAINSWLRELNAMQWDIPARRGDPACVVPVNFPNACVMVGDTELQQTYARGLAPLQECLASPCKPCNFTEDLYLSRPG